MAKRNRIENTGTETGATAATESNGESKPPESKADKFTRLAKARMPRALRAIVGIGRLSTRSQYSYTPEQAAQIVADLSDAVDAVRHHFSGAPAAKAEWTFRA